jgi:hypothetical protein
MNHVPHPRHTPGHLTSFYWSGDAMRSRSVSGTVLTATLDVPVPPARVLSDWEREMATRLYLEPGDVEQMPLARTQARWPEYGLCARPGAVRRAGERRHRPHGLPRRPLPP